MNWQPNSNGEQLAVKVNLDKNVETNQEHDINLDDSKIDKVKISKFNQNNGSIIQNEVSNATRSTQQQQVTDRLTFERKCKSSKPKNNGDTQVNAQNKTTKIKINNDLQSEVKSKDDDKNEPCQELVNHHDMIQNDDVVGSVSAIMQHETNTKPNSECKSSISVKNIMRNGRNIERSETANKTVLPKNINSVSEKVETLESMASSTTGPMNSKLKCLVLKGIA